MDAKDLVRAMIAEFAQLPAFTGTETRLIQAGMFDMIVHAAMVAYETSPTVAREFVSEEVQERIAAMAD